MADAGISYGTVTGRVLAGLSDHDGDPETLPQPIPAVGHIVFTPQVRRIVIPGADIVILPQPVRVELDEEGRFSVALVATNSAGSTPQDWTYRVSFDLVSKDVSPGVFSVHVPGGTTVDLADITPVDESEGFPITAGPQGPQGEPGPQGPQGQRGSLWTSGPYWPDQPEGPANPQEGDMHLVVGIPVGSGGGEVYRYEGGAWVYQGNISASA